MKLKAKGRYTKMNKRNPLGIGRCDYSGLMVAHRDLCKQMRNAGTGAFWTGLWVYRKFLDKLNAQELAPRLKADPVPIKFSKPDQMVAPEQLYPLTIDITGLSEYVVTFGQASANPFILSGTPNVPFIFRLPQVLATWNIVNGTSSDLQAALVTPISSINPLLAIPANSTVTFYADAQTLSTQPFIP